MDLQGQPTVIGVVAAGGALGATARYGASLAWPTPAQAFPWTTFVVNVTGCAALGALMVVLTEVMTAPHPLLRPFLGTGFCGGYTTFSTYGLDTEHLLHAGDPARGLLYLGGTLVTALAAVWAGATVARTMRTRARKAWR